MSEINNILESIKKNKEEILKLEIQNEKFVHDISSIISKLSLSEQLRLFPIIFKEKDNITKNQYLSLKSEYTIKTILILNIYRYIY